MSKAKFESTVGSIKNSRKSQNGISRQSSQGANRPETFKVIVIGDSNVGKTCLALRLCSGIFKDRREPTIGFDLQYKTVRIGDKEVKLQIWDTAGQERYRFRNTLSQQYYRNVNAVVFVYDVTDSKSFENIVPWMEECQKQYGASRYDDLLKVLVGNKNDMKERRVVARDRAEKFAEYHRMDVFETSAKDENESEYIGRIFTKLADQLVNGKHPTEVNRQGVKRLSDLDEDESSSNCAC